MALIKQGGADISGMVMTTTGLKKARPPVCTSCRERKTGLYTLDSNGQLVCADCSGDYGRGIVTDDVTNPSQDRD